jgi:two-component system response regulator FlrC
VDVRIIAATNRDLRAGIRAGYFREDLYFRVSTFRINVPGLSSRLDDILPLANYFLVKHGREDRALQLSPEASAKLLAYSWPGNVRELENVVQRAIVLSGDDVISANHLVFDEPADHELYIGEPSGMPASLMNPSHTPSYAGASSAMQGAANNVHPLDSGYGQRDRWRDTQGAPTNPFSAHMAAQSGFESLPEETSDSTTGLQGAMDANEFRIIVDTIKNTRTRQEAADMLGISQRTLRYKIARMRERGIQIPKRRSA